jgi:polyferredoxin
MKKISLTQIIRYLSLTVFLVIVSVMAFRHQTIGGGPGGAATVDSICPFGGIETLYNYVAGGEFIKKTNISNFILLAGTIFLALLLGRIFCGWICMLGWLQELFARLGRWIFKKRFIIPAPVDKPLRYVKYVVLVVIIFFTWRTGELVFSPYDPFVAYAHLPAGISSVIEDTLIGLIILFGSLILSIFFDRFFCKYLCPLGAFLGLFTKVNAYNINRDKETCINCNKCSKICPVNIDVAVLDSAANSECINCMECVTVCPTKKDTLKPFVAGKFFKPLIVGLAGIVIYIVIIEATDLAGVWKTTESNFAEVVSKQGTLDPYSIRGFMTLDEIAKTFSLDINLLYKELGLSPEKVPASTKMKELKNFDDKIKENTVRDAVAKIKGIKKK